MRPRDLLPAGTQAHREHFAEVVRATAFRLAESLGSGEIGGEVYRGLPVGDRRCQGVFNKFLDLVEHEALELLAMAVAARDLPAGSNIYQLNLRKKA